MYLFIYIGEGTRASESQNPATPKFQGNGKVGVDIHYYDGVLLTQMASPQRSNDTSLSESMYRSIMYTHTHT